MAAKKKTSAKVKKASAARKKINAPEDKRESPREMVTAAKAKNLKRAAGKRNTANAVEATEPGKRPTRKSTRGGSNRAKPDSQKKRAQTGKTRSPKARHSSRAG
jgi:hypothetical protein